MKVFISVLNEVRKSMQAKFSESQLYDVHPAVMTMVEWVKALKEKTGKSLNEWHVDINSTGLKTEIARRDWLKKTYGLGTNTADWLAKRSVGIGYEEETPKGYLKIAPQYVELQYSDKKAHLKPIYNELTKIGRGIASDVKICPCKTIVPLFRNHVFAQIKPSTNNRVDLGLALGNLKPSGRLIDTGGFVKKDRITHRLEITSQVQIDSEVIKWLKTAYGLDAKK